MARLVLSFILQGIVLPLAFLTGIVLKQNGQSFLYLLLLFINPSVPIPTVKTMFGLSGFYQKFVLFLTIINMLGSLAFQVVLISHHPYGNILQPPCSTVERYLRYLGLVRLNDLDVWTITRTLTPEIIILATTLIIHAACKSLNPWLFEEQLLAISGGHHKPETETTVYKIKMLNRTFLVTKYVSLATLCCAGIIYPCVLNGVYFLSFLTIMTIWGFNIHLRLKFAYFSRLLLIYVACHITALFGYQMQWAQELMPSDSNISRYLGLIVLTKTTCDDPRMSQINYQYWDSFANPFVLIILYHLLHYVAKLIINIQKLKNKELERKKRKKIMLMSRGEEKNDTKDNSPEGENLRKGAGETADAKTQKKMSKKRNNCCDTLLNTIILPIQRLLMRSSYLGANMAMMAWSITYHAWLTFVLLLWASILWLVPKQRKAMLKCSPYLVFYAIFLLIAQYIYSMKLNDNELPQTVNGVNLKQIGFVKVLTYPIEPLSIKILFSLLFWVTLREYNRELKEQKEKKPVESASQMAQLGIQAGGSRAGAWFEKFGTICRGIFTKFWIWIVTCILFAIGITGQQVTIIRIVYMSMALLFILTFQFNFTLWRKMMYTFWLVLILYSMLVLVVTYTYQFDNIENIWEEQLKIPLKLQFDIGLEKFNTKELFVKLLIPTLFVTITVLQLHYFHHEFMIMSDMKKRGNENVPTMRSSVIAHGPFDIVPLGPDGDRPKPVKKNSCFKVCNRTINFIWLFLELHLMKFIMLSVMVLAASEVCAVHLLLLTLAVSSMLMNKSMQILISHVCSSIISALIIIKMVYQINYINHNQWDVYCAEDNTTRNNAEWLGFKKLEPDQTLFSLLKSYVGVLVIITIYAVVLRRQKFQRYMQGRQLYRPYVMFPKITHHDIDKDIPHFLKYMVNYQFYRFGVELCLTAIVALIAIRMDFYATLYGLILCFLVTMSRKHLSKVWPFLLLFVIVTILFQYALAVGLPPYFCIVYPWNQSDMLERLRDWMFLPDTKHPPATYKLICDFIVLILVSRQLIVFHVEKKHKNEEYKGGSNKPVFHMFDEKGFVNPVPDFFSATKSVLDVMKRVGFAASYWICLATVFLAGTNRVNVFSLGYLIGAFIFLWQGNDLYLRPIRTILVWWNSLLAYNVGVIFLKALLQIIGCIFITTMKAQACWMIQLFGIRCIQKFEEPTAPSLDSGECTVPKSEVGLAWDSCCFAMLIFQRRLFSSYYFMRMVDEAKAMATLASRGAELIDELSNKQVEFQMESEKQLLDKIKQKMEKIKASQKKLHGPNYQEPGNHYRAVRSGDYFMFDDYDEDIDLISELSIPSFTTTLSDENIDLRRTSLTQLVTIALKTDLKTAFNDAAITNLKPKEESEPIESEGQPGPSGVTKKKKKKKWGRNKNRIRRSISGSIYQDKTQSGSEGRSRKTEVKRSCCESFGRCILTFITSIMVSITRLLNRTSRDYRYIMKTLSVEKRIILMTHNFGSGMRSGPGNVWKPGPYIPGSSRDISASWLSEEGELKATDQSPFIRMILAFWFAMLSHTELSSYTVIFLHQIFAPTILSLPLPLMVFCWGTLTVPRPSKTFWVTVIAYTEIVVVIKCIFQFQFISWNKNPIPINKPFEVPRIIGIEKIPGTYAYFDLMVLLVVFLHRTVMKRLGLWRSTNSIRSEDTEYPHTKPNEAVVITNEKKKKEIEHKKLKRDSSSSSSSSSSTSSTSSGGPSYKSRSRRRRSMYKPKDIRYQDVDSLLSDGDRIERKGKNPCLEFFRRLLVYKGRVTTDVYAYMFFFDFVNLLIVIFGFSSFGMATSTIGEGGVQQYFYDDKVPPAFVVMLIVQFGLIIIDRTLYLRKFILGKLIYQYILVFGVHIWMFFILPFLTGLTFNSTTPPMLWYMCKCFYLLLSAYQIRCGYPTRIFGNFLCRSYNYINYFLFKIYMAIPFVYELRTLMDWIWTDTSMTLTDWIKMEDIFANVFELKCERRAEDEYPQPRGEKKTNISKYLLGGSCVFAIIAIIWFPLVFFSLGNTVGTSNIPTDIEVSIRIGAFSPIYHITARNNSIHVLTKSQWEAFKNVYFKSRNALNFLSNYVHSDVGIVMLNQHSTVVWSISPSDKNAMQFDLESDKSLNVRLDWTINRIKIKSDDDKPLEGSKESVLPLRSKKAIVNYLKKIPSSEQASLPLILPKFLHVTRKYTKVVAELVKFDDAISKFDDSTPYRTIDAQMNEKDNTVWWQVDENLTDPLAPFLKKLPGYEREKLVIYTFNEKSFPSTFSYLTGKGLLSLLFGVIVLVHRILRILLGKFSERIIFKDWPTIWYVDKLVKFVHIARAFKDYATEEDVFTRIIFLYRSPETLIKVTRYLPEPVARTHTRPIL